MGCASSKLEDEEAVAHCLQRTALLSNTIQHRFALAEAHASYSASLRSIGAVLHEFITSSQSIPVLTLPPHKKGDPLLPPGPLPQSQAGHSPSHSCGSHIQFVDSDSDDDSPLHCGVPSPIQLQHDQKQLPPPSMPLNFGTFVQPEFFYDHPDSYYGHQYPDSYSDMSHGAGALGSLVIDSDRQNSMVVGFDSAEISRDPPPPPSPQGSSAWEFINVFDGIDNYYTEDALRTSSKQLRTEEVTRELEDENEVVKEAYGDRNFVASTLTPGAGENHSKDKHEAKVVGIGSGKDDGYGKSRTLESGSGSEHEVHVVEKSVVMEEVDKKPGMSGYATIRSYQSVSEIMLEIKSQFERASEFAGEVSKMLEVGKLPYDQNNSAYKVTARMVCGIPSFSKSEDFLFYEEDKAMGCGNLSSTLQKLYMWEKKLLEEVKVEERMRILYERKWEQLTHMKDRGAAAEKFEELEIYIRKLSSKIKIAIQVVDAISNNINRLRDEELWPEINELIQGFMKMWSAMSDCHRIQLQAISEAKILDSVVLRRQFTEAHTNVIKRLELELLEWTGNFSIWLAAQRSFVNSLNSWLVQGLHYEPEVTDDGVPPFSPGRLGAPPVFVICNFWSQSMERISEKDVVNVLQSFATHVFQLWKQQSCGQHQILTAKNDMDKTLRLLQREEQEIQKKMQAQNKKLLIYSQFVFPVSEETENRGPVGELGGLEQSLKQIFEAMKNFTECNMKSYEDLYAKAEKEKEKLVGEKARVQLDS